MTDQRTLKRIIDEKKDYIAKKELQISILANKIAEAHKRLENTLAYLPSWAEIQLGELYLISGASLMELKDLLKFLANEEMKK